MSLLPNLLLILLCLVSEGNSDDFQSFVRSVVDEWKDEVSPQIRADVIDDARTVFDEETRNLRRSHESMKALLFKERQRVSRLNQQIRLLEERVSKLQSQGSSKDISTGSGNHRNKELVAVGEHRSGDIWIIDVETDERWKIKSRKGIMGISFHPVSRLLYVVVAFRKSGIVSLSFPEGKMTIIKKCGNCVALGLDARENILFYTENEMRGSHSHIQRFDLMKNTTIDPLVSYSIKQEPSVLTVDDVHKHVFVALRGDGVIEQLSYKGKLLREIYLEGGVKHSTTLSMAINKPERILYYNVADRLYQVKLEVEGYPELVDQTEYPRPSSLNFLKGQLVVAYMDNSQMDTWTPTGRFQKVLDLGIVGSSGSKHICLIE